MEDSTIFNMLYNEYVSNWKDKIISKDECRFVEYEQSERDRIVGELGGDADRLLNEYRIAIVNREDYVFYELGIKIFNFGFRAGMQLQQSYADNKE